MIDLQNVNKSYGQGDTAFHVLKDINLHIDQGEFVAIMGPSGSGKTTLINIIGFLDTAFEGKYLLKTKMSPTSMPQPLHICAIVMSALFSKTSV